MSDSVFFVNTKLSLGYHVTSVLLEHSESQVIHYKMVETITSVGILDDFGPKLARKPFLCSLSLK